MVRRANLFVASAIAAGLIAAAIPAGAAEHATPEQAKALVQDAVTYLKAKGSDEAIKSFNDPKGNFVRGELYIFVFDKAGNYVASGANPRLAGTTAADLKDAEGKPLVQEMIAATRDKPEAAVDYVWLNRKTNKVEHKHSYVVREGGYIIGSGTYGD
jgi:cytochrome c